MKTKTLKSVTLSLLFAFLAGGRAHADQDVSTLKEETRKDLMNVFIQRPTSYVGMKNGWFDEGEGTFCRKESSYSVMWNANIGLSDLNLRDNGSVHIHLAFKNTSIEISSFRKGGLSCTWYGGGARVNLDQVSIDFDLAPIGADSRLNLDFTGFEVSGLSLDHLTIATPIYSALDGTAPDWINELVENNLNFWVAEFLKSNLHKRLNNFASDKFAEWVKAARERSENSSSSGATLYK